ncbi:MAG: CAP domain-containing protein [Ruminococcus sp.]|jgi:uncharacterized protein YkwD|nr:CAP domain-containing protein [Ruminococcus sp.]
MKKSVRVLSVAAAAALAFSMSATSASAYCGLSAQDLAQANNYSYNYGNSSGDCYTLCPECGKVSYGTECVYPECSTGDCYGNCPDNTCPTGECESDCYGNCPDNTCPTGECETDCNGSCPDNTCPTGDCDADNSAKTPTAGTNTTYTKPNNSLNFSSWLSQIFNRFYKTPANTVTPSTPATPAQPATPATPAAPVTNVTDNASCSAYAQEILSLINVERAKVGAPALKLSSELCNAADIRAKEIAQSFSHTRPDGSSFYSVLDDIGYSGSRSSGENIAAGNSSAAATFNQWMNSQGHYENMMKSGYKYMGIGFYQTSNGYKYHWAQLFSY